MKALPILLGMGLVSLWPATIVADDAVSDAYAAVHAIRMLRRDDKNGDGQLEPKECGRQWARLSQLDTNGDGRLDESELFRAPVLYLSSPCRQQRNILYKKTPQEDLYLDIYYPHGKQTAPLPVVFYTHGGGWVTGSKQGIAVGPTKEVAIRLLEAGFCVVSVNYRLCNAESGVFMRDCVTDAKDAVRYLTTHADRCGVDPLRFSAFGDSAGGQIAQMLVLSSAKSLPGEPSLATARYRMCGGVSWYGPSDFEHTELFNHDDRPGFRDRFGARILFPQADPQEKIKRYREMSPVTYLTGDSPPLLLIQGDADTTIPVKHAHFMKQRADDIGAAVEAIIVQNAGHNWRSEDALIEPSVATIVDKTVEFLTAACASCASAETGRRGR